MPAAPLHPLLAAGVCFLVILREWKGCNRGRSFSVEHSPQASARKLSEPPQSTTVCCIVHTDRIQQSTWGPLCCWNWWGSCEECPLRPTISTLQVLTLLRPSLSPSELETLPVRILTGTRAKRMHCPTSRDVLSTFLRCTRNICDVRLVGWPRVTKTNLGVQAGSAHPKLEEQGPRNETC